MSEKRIQWIDYEKGLFLYEEGSFLYEDPYKDPVEKPQIKEEVKMKNALIISRLKTKDVDTDKVLKIAVKIQQTNDCLQETVEMPVIDFFRGYDKKLFFMIAEKAHDFDYANDTRIYKMIFFSHVDKFIIGNNSYTLKDLEEWRKEVELKSTPIKE